MNMFARFDENPAMTLRVIKETKRYGRTDGRTDTRTGGIMMVIIKALRVLVGTAALKRSNREVVS